MSNSQVQVPRASDTEVVEFFENTALEIGESSFTVQFLGRSSSIEFDVPLSDVQKRLVDSRNFSIVNASVSAQNFSIGYRRADLAKGEDYFYDSLSFYNAGSAVSDEQLAVIYQTIQNSFADDPAVTAGLFKNPKLFRDLIASHHRQVVELQKTVSSIGKQAAEARITLEKEYYDRKRQLETEIKQKSTQLKSDHDDLRKAIQEQESALSERKKALDDRDNTHARRQIRSDLKERLKQYNTDLKITKETTRLRVPVHVGVGIGLCVMVGLILYHTWMQSIISSSENRSVFESVAILVKPVGLTIAALGLGAWYLRWMNRWFERHSELEFQLKQFELDIDRASWVVETALEWRQEQRSTIPNHLLESISRNLFSKSDKDETADMHPADYLASALLGKASALRLTVPGGGELEYGPKALREAAKSDIKS